MPHLTVIANITAKSDQIDFVKEQAEKLIAPTRSENGCLRYDLHQDNKNPAHFVFYETWESPAHLQAHMESAHFKAFVAAVEGALETLTVEELTQIA